MKILLPGNGEVEYTKVTDEGIDTNIGLGFEFLSGDVNWLGKGGIVKKTEFALNSSYLFKLLHP